VSSQSSLWLPRLLADKTLGSRRAITRRHKRPRKEDEKWNVRHEKQKQMLSLKHAHSVMHRNSPSQIVLSDLRIHWEVYASFSPCFRCIRMVMLVVRSHPSVAPLAPRICCPLRLDTILPAAQRASTRVVMHRLAKLRCLLPQQLDGEFPRPLPSGCFVSSAVGFVDMSDLGNKRIIGVRVSQHRADGQKYFGYRQSRAPLVSENIQTDTAVRVDVGMIDSGGEVDLRWLKRVVCGKVDGQEEDTSLERAVTGTHDRCLPVK